MSQTVTGPVVVLRREMFLARARAEGLYTRSAIAGHLGVSRPTITRLLEEQNKPGGEVIARTLLAFPKTTFEDFFEVREAA